MRPADGGVGGDRRVEGTWEVRVGMGEGEGRARQSVSCPSAPTPLQLGSRGASRCCRGVVLLTRSDDVLVVVMQGSLGGGYGGGSVGVVVETYGWRLWSLPYHEVRQRVRIGGDDGCSSSSRQYRGTDMGSALVGVGGGEGGSMGGSQTVLLPEGHTGLRSLCWPGLPSLPKCPLLLCWEMRLVGHRSTSSSMRRTGRGEREDSSSSVRNVGYQWAVMCVDGCGVGRVVVAEGDCGMSGEGWGGHMGEGGGGTSPWEWTYYSTPLPTELHPMDTILVSGTVTTSTSSQAVDMTSIHILVRHCGLWLVTAGQEGDKKGGDQTVVVEYSNNTNTSSSFIVTQGAELSCAYNDCSDLTLDL